MRILFLLLFVIPLIELYLLIQVGNVIGALPTVLLTIATGVAGVVLMRSQGLATIQTAQQQMAAGESPQLAMMEGVFIFLGGVMLFFPGLVSDFIGLLLLVPWIRRLIIGRSMVMQSRGSYRYQNQDNVFEGQWDEKTPEPPKSVPYSDDEADRDSRTIEGDWQHKDK